MDDVESTSPRPGIKADRPLAQSLREKRVRLVQLLLAHPNTVPAAFSSQSAVPPFPRQQVAPVRRLCPPARWTPPAHSRRSTRRYRAPNGPGPARWPEMGQCHLANGRGRHSHAERIKGGAPNMRFNSASAWVTAGWLVAMCSRSVGLPALRAGAAAHASESQH